MVSKINGKVSHHSTFFFINNKKKWKKTKLHMLQPVCKIKYFDFFFFCLLSNKKYGVWKISNWKINTWKIPTHQILPLRISSGKFSPRKFSPGIFPPMFINIFFHHYHRYHQYCLKDCFVFLFLKKMLKSDLLRCIKKNLQLACHSENVLDMMGMFSIF